ncbi:hypothetical protein Halru_2282 [Halovivax ruber XH-70]|uniref:Uncharacterized protein n=1 Tax=Halovivax ruber (strain DSM 18193 / JCM 13892 / XH-70) TaxID=797302 RepID=L0IDH2_HALRX|nr:hypothetical protein Halru_2282 [Halovivax ruber XH-70]
MGFGVFDGAIGPQPRLRGPSSLDEEFLAPGIRPIGVQPYERSQLLERVERDGATVGVDIPDRLDVQGEELDLQSFVFEIKRRETIPSGERDRVDQAKRNLRRERVERVERIEEGDITFEEGEELASAIIGIDRALNALENLGPTNLEREQQAQELADRKRWLSFLKKALGEEDDASSRGGR